MCFYVVEIILGLEYMYNCFVVYWDLKLVNIFLDEYGYVWILDLGLVCDFFKKKFYVSVGIYGYMVLEVL